MVKDNEEIAEKIHVHIKSHGSQLAPMDCWLLLRGIKTLPVRMDRHNENAKKVAEWLRTQPKVKKFTMLDLRITKIMRQPSNRREALEV